MRTIYYELSSHPRAWNVRKQYNHIFSNQFSLGSTSLSSISTISVVSECTDELFFSSVVHILIYETHRWVDRCLHKSVSAYDEMADFTASYARVNDLTRGKLITWSPEPSRINYLTRGEIMTWPSLDNPFCIINRKTMSRYSEDISIILLIISLQSWCSRLWRLPGEGNSDLESVGFPLDGH